MWPPRSSVLALSVQHSELDRSLLYGNTRSRFSSCVGNHGLRRVSPHYSVGAEDFHRDSSATLHPLEEVEIDIDGEVVISVVFLPSRNDDAITLAPARGIELRCPKQKTRCPHQLNKPNHNIFELANDRRHKERQCCARGSINENDTVQLQSTSQEKMSFV